MDCHVGCRWGEEGPAVDTDDPSPTSHLDQTPGTHIVIAALVLKHTNISTGKRNMPTAKAMYDVHSLCQVTRARLI